MEKFVVFEGTQLTIYESISEEKLGYNSRPYELPTDSEIFLSEESIGLKSIKGPYEELIITTSDGVFGVLNKDLYIIH